MKIILITTLAICGALSAIAQTDTTKVESIKLNELQKTSITQFDNVAEEIKKAFNENEERRSQYVKGIIEALAIDPKTITDIRVKNGYLMYKKRSEVPATPKK